MRLSQYHEDAIAEAVNIGIGRAASCLSEMVGATVLLNVPSVTFCAYAGACKQVSVAGGGPITSITQAFNGTIAGSAAIVLSEDDAITLAQLLHGDTHTATTLDILQQGILEEVGNIILNGVLGSLSNLMSAKLLYGVPKFKSNANLLLSLSSSGSDHNEHRDVLLANTRFAVAERSVQGSLLIVFDVGSVQVLIDALESLAT